MSIVQNFQKIETYRNRSLARGSSDRPGRQSVSQKRSLIPVWETALGIAAIVGIGVLWPGGGWGLLSVQPHPLWIVVLAVAVRYGGLYGYLAGGASALAYGLLLWTRPEVRFQSLASTELVQPLLMLVVGAALGELVAARERRLAQLEARRRKANSALAALWRRYRAAETLRAELEKKIAFQSNGMSEFVMLGKRLQTLRLSNLHHALVDLVSVVLESEACAFYVYHGGKLMLEAGKPESWPGRQRMISERHPLVSRALRERRAVTVRDQLVRGGGQTSEGQSILMAGPVLPHDGPIYGVVLIESISFSKFTPAMVDRFELILEWASAALTNAMLYEQARIEADVAREVARQADVRSNGRRRGERAPLGR